MVSLEERWRAGSRAVSATVAAQPAAAAFFPPSVASAAPEFSHSLKLGIIDVTYCLHKLLYGHSW